MGRNPKLRTSYINDAQLLMRLAKAVEMDSARPEEWRKGVIAKLEDISSELLRAPRSDAA